MTRTLSTLMSVGFGTLLLVSAGCEDKATKEALATCNTKYQDLQKTSSAQMASLAQTKTELAQAQAKVQELTKEMEQLKNSKPAKTETPPGKKAAHRKKK